MSSSVDSEALSTFLMKQVEGEAAAAARSAADGGGFGGGPG